MKDPINEQNIKADETTYGKWSMQKDQFADSKPLQLLYGMFKNSNMELPFEIKVAEYGSADGRVGEFFKEELENNGHQVNLTIIDVVKKHLDANFNPKTSKIHKSLLELNLHDVFDLGLARSIFHYFSIKSQHIVAINIFNSLKPGGFFLSQNFVQRESDLELYLKLNRAIGKDFQLADERNIKTLFGNAGFINIMKIGELPTWHYTSDDLMKRYSLWVEDIQKMRQQIENTPHKRRSGFHLTENGFTIPVPYKVFLMQKPR